MERIESFSGPYRFLSNFWPISVKLVGTIYAKCPEYPQGLSFSDGLIYNSVEHAYQAAKSDNPFDWEEIQKLETPGKAKKYGSNLKVRFDWNPQTKIDVMTNLVTQKFWFKEPLLTQKLLQTGNAELIEGNTWNDTFWGQTKEKDQPWTGENHLGKILMQVRRELQIRKETLKESLNYFKGTSSWKVARELALSERELFVMKLCFELG